MKPIKITASSIGFEDNRTLGEASQKECGASFSADIKNLPGFDPLQLDLGEPALAGRMK